jgi:chromosome segregation ATPase
MKDKSAVDVRIELEGAQTQLAEAEAHEKELRTQFQQLLDEKNSIEFNLGSLTKGQERKLQSVRTEFAEAQKIFEARRDRVRELKVLAQLTEVNSARVKKKEFIERVVQLSKSAVPHLEALTEITAKIHEVESAEYEFTRAENHRLGLEGRFALPETLRFNCGSLLPPSFNLTSWVERASKAWNDFLPWA